MDTRITTVDLFNMLEVARINAGMTIPEVTVLIGVSDTTYVAWRRGVVPKAEKEPALRDAIKHIEAVMNSQ